MGINVYATRYLYTMAGGLLAGLAGAALSLASVAGWADERTVGGLGWIAVGLVIFATWNPWRAAAGAYLFGAMAAIPYRLPMPSYFVESLLKTFPCLATILVLVIATQETMRRRIGAPAALGLPFVREEKG